MVATAGAGAAGAPKANAGAAGVGAAGAVAPNVGVVATAGAGAAGAPKVNAGAAGAGAAGGLGGHLARLLPRLRDAITLTRFHPGFQAGSCPRAMRESRSRLLR